ncbi:MAG TPA: hypothetical protein VLJ68_14200, partial [Chitinophagaceae bacterium]|nr:hypothetical protein [Chitinophagaceae bacterium]
MGEDAFLNFKGKTWENESSALLTDETAGVSGVGGWIRFLSNNSKQQIIGGYNAATKTGPAFSRIQIQNNLGVELTGSNAKVRREVLFSDGHIYLNDNTMVVGDNNPGIISGYDSTKYFITANTPGLGILVRENVRTSDGRVDFPIGTSINSFTPSAIRNVSAPGDDYYATVVDSVRDNLINGNNLQTRGVNKTWEIGKLSADLNGEIEVFLQHVITEEGSIFQANRNKAFVSAYTPGGWDIGYPQSLPDDGYLTTGNILTGSGTNRRLADNMVGTSFYFSKFTGTGDSLNTKLWFNAYRVNPAIVKAY